MDTGMRSPLRLMRRTERRRRRAGDDQRHGSVLLHLLLQVAEEFRLHQQLEAFFATFPASQVEQEDANCGPCGRGQHIFDKLLMMPDNQNHGEQIATDRQEEK